MQTLKVLARSYVSPAEMDAAIAFYEHLLQETCQVRFPIPELQIEIAVVGGIHIVAGTKDALAPFVNVRAAFFVDSVVEAKEVLERTGAEILQQPQQGPNGLFMIARHPDGLVVEYADSAGP